ncbi:hypothetical protein JTB14_035521 [Gonioctena quinquepunctata]|nr:hypothetical protein JTB14_035521 [Gonioctena quinquepunctata]
MKRLKCKTQQRYLQISGISQGTTSINEMVNIIIESQDPNDFQIRTKEITCPLPLTKIDISVLNIPTDWDKHSDIPGQIDILIRADLYYELIEPGLMRLGNNLPVSLYSKLGWLLGGPIPLKQICSMSVTLFSHTPEINELPKFWQLEEISTKRILSQEICFLQQHDTQMKDAFRYISLSNPMPTH